MTATAVPRWLFVPAGIALALVVVPVGGMLARVPWQRAVALLADPHAASALRLSLVTSGVTLLLCLLLGTPLAVCMARARGVWRQVAQTLTTIPMVLPPVVAGLALLVTFGRRGVIGSYLSVLGIEIGFTTIAVVLGQTFVALPYFVIAVEGALRAQDPGLERIAASLGASPTRTLARVTLPLLGPALLSGSALAFARALGEFGATLTFAGSLPGVTQTLPQAIYLAREVDPDSALVLATIPVGLAILLTVLAGAAARGRPAAR